MNAELIEKGTKATLKQLNANGFDAGLFLFDTDAKNLSALVRQLKEGNYDGVVIGNGIRGTKANFILFERIINTVHQYAPGSRIIFNTLPMDTTEAVKRWL